MKQFLLIFLFMQGLVLEAITINWLIILFIMTYASIFSTCIVNIWNSLHKFKAWLDKFWPHQAVKYDFTADLTVTRNRLEEIINRVVLYKLDISMRT